MTNSERNDIYGIDVAKDHLIICQWSDQALVRVTNEPGAVQAWLDCLQVPARIALEPTGSYHRVVHDLALRGGHQVYPVNPRQLAHYRHAVNVRNKTDPQDAWLLARYLAHEEAQLRPARQQGCRAQRLWALVARRATLVRSRQQLQMSFAQVQFSIRGLLRQYDTLLQRVDREIQALLRELGWWTDYQRCQSVPGIGPVNAAALTASYHRGHFTRADCYIAFLGLDVRLRQSGRYQGQRKLTKQGPSELRRLLFCATYPARHHARFDTYYRRQLDKGLSKIAARVVLARKLARICFALMKREESYVG